MKSEDQLAWNSFKWNVFNSFGFTDFVFVLFPLCLFWTYFFRKKIDTIQLKCNFSRETSVINIYSEMWE